MFNNLNFFKFICEDANVETAPWIVKSFPIIKIVLMCLIFVCAVAMIIMVIMQKGEANGVSAINGQSDTFYNRNKRGTLQGKIKTLTIVDAVLIMVFCIAFLVIHSLYKGFIV